jgi:hypothetical protein
VPVTEIATGLWRWTALHPEWTPADSGPEGWEQEVGCVYYEGPDAVVLFDPLLPAEDPGHFYGPLDRDVERAGKPVRVLLTVDAHLRSSETLADRYGATVAALPGRGELDLPAGVELGAEAVEEFVFSIPEHATLVAGDVIVGLDGGLWIPRPWLGNRYGEAVERLRPLLELHVQRLLPGHGEPVLENARDALEQALND